jgi:hypothetical protein
MKPGYIYILTNPSYRSDFVKIGLTENNPSERAKELSSSTGVPMEFEVAYSEAVHDCQALEKEIHDHLSDKRSNAKREFFQIPLEEAIKEVHKIAEESRSQSPFCEKCESRKSLGIITEKNVKLEQELSSSFSQIEQGRFREESLIRKIYELEKKISRIREEKLIKNIALIANLYTRRLNTLLKDVYIWHSRLDSTIQVILWLSIFFIFLICCVNFIQIIGLKFFMAVLAVMIIFLIIVGLSALKNENVDVPSDSDNNGDK